MAPPIAPRIEPIVTQFKKTLTTYSIGKSTPLGA